MKKRMPEWIYKIMMNRAPKETGKFFIIETAERLGWFAGFQAGFKYTAMYKERLGDDVWNSGNGSSTCECCGRTTEKRNIFGFVTKRTTSASKT